MALSRGSSSEHGLDRYDGILIPASVLTLNTAEPHGTPGVCPLNSSMNKISHKSSTDPARAGECMVSFIYILISHYIKGFEKQESDSDTVKISSKNLRKGGCVNLQQKQIISERFRYQPLCNRKRDTYYPNQHFSCRPIVGKHHKLNFTFRNQDGL